MPHLNHHDGLPIARIRHLLRSLFVPTVFATFLICGNLLLTSFVQGDEQLAYDRDNQDNQVARLVNQLNDSRYAVRESALEKLTNVGAPALRPLALKAISGSPESAWRVKQALESIGTQGDEATFFQAIGILQLLYLDGSQSLSAKTIQLQAQWRLKQKKDALENLRKLGAIIRDPFENQPDLPNGIGIFEQRILINGIAVNRQAGLALETNPALTMPVTTPSSRSQKSPRQLLDPTEATQKVDEILLASIDENRKNVFDNAPGKPTTQPDEVKSVDQEQMELQLRIAALRRQNGMNLGLNRDAGVSISLGPQWEGQADDLRQLEYLDGLAQIELANFRPGPSQLKELTELNSVSAIKIVGNEIPNADLKQISQMRRLRELELADRTIDTPTLKNISAAPNLAHLMFTRCEIPADSLAELAKLKSLNSLFFSEMHVTADIFSVIEELDQLTYINLAVCKFETTAYRNLKRTRPTLQIAFTPQAFLGVRGPSDFNDLNGCEISQVVEGSGAEKGGMQAGDVIVKIDDESIERFEDLRLHIAQYKAGEILNVTVHRDGQPIKLKIELTRYDTHLE